MDAELRARLDRGLGLFDLDGTLIAWDTQILFCDFVLKKQGMRRMWLPFFVSMTPFAGVLGDEGMKRVFLCYLWRTSPEQLQEWTSEFVSLWFPARCYEPLLARISHHRQQGHLTVLASASPEFYVKEVGRVLGFDLALGTQVETAGALFPLLPDLVNHKGAEKVRRLSEMIGMPESGIWANSHGYTDSSADLPMMACCENGTLVNPSFQLARLGGQRNWTIVRQERPWRTTAGKATRILSRISGLGGK